MCKKIRSERFTSVLIVCERFFTVVIISAEESRLVLVTKYCIEEMNEG
jgi:hypothetical protein